MSVNHPPRGRMRRMGESAFGLLLLGKVVVFCVVVLLLLLAGALTSWSAAQDSMVPGRERGTIKVRSCERDVCTGTFVPSGTGSVRTGVRIDESVTRGEGETLAVAVKPGTKTVVRTGPAGIMHAWVPFGGALILASLVVAGGLGWRRTAVATGVLGGALMGAAFLLL